jgi:hypothetical protein
LTQGGVGATFPRAEPRSRASRERRFPKVLAISIDDLAFGSLSLYTGGVAVLLLGISAIAAGQSCEITGMPDADNGDSRPIRPFCGATGYPLNRGDRRRRLPSRRQKPALAATKAKIAVKQRAERVRTRTSGSPTWIRTTIHGSKGRCPTIRRSGSMALGTGGGSRLPFKVARTHGLNRDTYRARASVPHGLPIGVIGAIERNLA